MIDKTTYLQLKRDIRCLCRSNVVKLCEDMELTHEEKNLLMNFYDNKSVQHVCMEIGVSEPTYNRCMKRLFSKINNYKNTH